MKNIVAPKDPEKMRPFFYIMRDKEIYGSKMEDGRGIQYLYQSDGRLESSAKVTGSIEDEQIIELLKTVDGFKKLVHSVGVSIELEDKDAKAEFIFQMYGKKDLYGGGANIQGMVDGSGSETRLYLSDVDWQDDDDIPGQIKIIMDEPDKLGNLTVRLYLNDGFTAPEQEEEHEIDTASDAYKKMISNSLIQTGNTYRLSQVISKAKRGERVTLAYIGGSITQGAGATPINTECYAYKSYTGFKKLFGTDNVEFVKAGVGGTPSELGMLRFNRDVLRDGEKTPDVVVVEFAVNDEGDETKGDCFESLVRKILALDNAPAVILLFSVFTDDYNLEERLIPVGKRYNLSMVSVKRAVTPQFYDKKNRIITKNQFFYDMFHPTNMGHTIQADCLTNLFEEVAGMPNPDSSYEPDFESAPAIGCTFDKVIFMDKKDTVSDVEIDEGGYTLTDEVLQEAELDDNINPTKQFPYNWMYDGNVCEKKPFKMKLSCKALVLIFKDSGEVDAAKANVFVDGKFVRLADPYENRWLHCNPIIIINEDATLEHEISIEVIPEDIDKKFTILGFGIVR